MYKLSDEDKQWVKHRFKVLFSIHFSQSVYWYWSMYPNCDKSKLKNIYFEDEFVGFLFSQLCKLKIDGEIGYAFYIYFKNEVLPTIEL